MQIKGTVHCEYSDETGTHKSIHHTESVQELCDVLIFCLMKQQGNINGEILILNRIEQVKNM